MSRWSSPVHDDETLIKLFPLWTWSSGEKVPCPSCLFFLDPFGILFLPSWFSQFPSDWSARLLSQANIWIKHVCIGYKHQFLKASCRIQLNSWLLSRMGSLFSDVSGFLLIEASNQIWNVLGSHYIRLEVCAGLPTLRRIVFFFYFTCLQYSFII